MSLTWCSPTNSGALTTMLCYASVAAMAAKEYRSSWESHSLHCCWLGNNSDTLTKWEKTYLNACSHRCTPFHTVSHRFTPFHTVSRKHAVQPGNCSKTVHTVFRLNVPLVSLSHSLSFSAFTVFLVSFSALTTTNAVMQRSQLKLHSLNSHS